MTGNEMLDKVIGIVSSIFLLATIGVFVYTEHIFQRTLPVDEQEFIRSTQEALKSVSGKTLKLDKVTINLRSRNSRLRFLDAEIHILPLKNKDFDELKNNMPFIYDAIIDITGKMWPEELNTLAGKILLEQRIKKQINELLKRPTIKRIYFTTFVVQ